MANPCTNMFCQRLSFGFAFNDINFSDRVLRVEIIPDSLDSKSESEGCEKLGKENECSTDAEVKTLHISSPILAANSPFFYKFFKNGMKESLERDVTLRINESEDPALMELLNFMYNNTLTSTTTSDLLGVLIIADKFKEEMMTLPLSAVEVILGSSETESWLLSSPDDVYEFILKWARSHYPNLQERCEVLTKRLTQFIRFHYMSGPKLKEVQFCPDFDHEAVSKLVNEALFFKIELPYGQHIHSSNKCVFIQVEQFDLPQPRCVVYFDMKKEECENLFTSIMLLSPSIHLGGRCFHLDARCHMRMAGDQQKSFGLFFYMTKESESCTVDYEFAVIKKSSNEFQTKAKGNFCNSDLLMGWGCWDLLGLSWTDFMSKKCEYFIDGILHLRVDLTINNAPP